MVPWATAPRVRLARRLAGRLASRLAPLVGLCSCPPLPSSQVAEPPPPGSPLPADDTSAFEQALGNASAAAAASGEGVAVLVPPGNYRITRRLSIRSSGVVLRGAGWRVSTLQFPYPLSQIYGSGQVWAYGGAWLT